MLEHLLEKEAMLRREQLKVPSLPHFVHCSNRAAWLFWREPEAVSAGVNRFWSIT
jgi:hypothetical protein